MASIYESVLLKPNHTFLEFWRVSSPLTCQRELELDICSNSEDKFYLKNTNFAIGEKRLQYRTGLNSEYTVGKWGFIAKKQDWGRDGRSLRGNIRGKEGF